MKYRLICDKIINRHDANQIEERLLRHLNVSTAISLKPLTSISKDSEKVSYVLTSIGEINLEKVNGIYFNSKPLRLEALTN